MEVYKAISAIIGEMSEQGIGKNSKNKQQGWQFRGIDAVYNALAPLLAKYELMILPRTLSRECTERQTRNGGAVFYVVVDCEFDFVSAKDGSKHTVRTFGEAMDSGDKATNKAMSIALKYAAFEAFFIPTEVTTNDADAETHQVIPHQFLDQKQQTDIQAHAESKGFTLKQVLDAGNVGSLAEVYANQYQDIISLIDSWQQP